MKYTHRDSFLGNSAKAFVPDFSSAKEAISEVDMADAAETKGGGARKGKNPKNKLRCVYITSFLPFIFSLVLSSCGSQLSSRQNTSYHSDMSIDEMRLELADVKHNLKSTQVELNLLDEQVKKQANSLSSTTKAASNSPASTSQVASLERRIADLEKWLEKTSSDLRNLSAHANQALTKLSSLEQEVSSHEKRLDEVVKLKGTLTSISNAIGQTSSSSVNSSRTYKVKAGDSLERIARSHKTSLASLKNLNNLKNDKIVVGQELRIPDESP